jgi:hypothetical protein
MAALLLYLECDKTLLNVMNDRERTRLGWVL